MEWKQRRRKSKEVEEGCGMMIADPPRTMESRMMMRFRNKGKAKSSLLGRRWQCEKEASAARSEIGGSEPTK